jgi:hypothetical protein
MISFYVPFFENSHTPPRFRTLRIANKASDRHISCMPFDSSHKRFLLVFVYLTNEVKKNTRQKVMDKRKEQE